MYAYYRSVSLSVRPFSYMSVSPHPSYRCPCVWVSVPVFDAFIEKCSFHLENRSLYINYHTDKVFYKCIDILEYIDGNAGLRPSYQPSIIYRNKNIKVYLYNN